MNWTAAVAVARRELLSEWRSRELVPALVQFVLLALVVALFAFDLDGSTASRIAPGLLWLVIAFAGLVSFGRAFATERERGTLEAVLMTPAGATSVFVGKAAAAVALLLACEAVLVPGIAVFLGVLLPPLTIAAAVLGTIGMGALGCLLSALAAQTRARELLLPVLALPLWVPLVVLGAAAVGTHAFSAIANLAAVDILFVVVSALAARFVLE